MPDWPSVAAPSSTAEQSPIRLSAIEWLFRRAPALDALRTYSRATLGRDLTAGLTVAAVAVPQAMAYATLAGLPPQYGLYTAIVMTAVGAFFDSSRQLINGPTNAISIALLSALALVPAGDRTSAAITLALLVGAIQLGIAFLRLGDLTRFVSHSVIVGFTLGAATLLVLDQTKYLFGLESRGAATDHTLTRFWLSMTAGGSVHWPTVLISIGTILVVIGVRQINAVLQSRRFRFPIPQHLVAVTLAAGLVWGFRLDAQGVKIIGAIPSSLPAFQLPEWKWDQVRLLAGSAFAVALLGLLEALAMAKAIAVRTGQKLNLNQQCLSEGAANFIGSFFQCFPGSGSLTRSAVNQQAGAVSQWSGVFAAAAVAGTVVLFAPLVGYIPRASLTALLLLAAYRMVDRRQLLFHLRATRFDAGVVLATAATAVLISVELCIVIGVFLSFALYVPRAARVRMVPLTPTREDGVRERRNGDPSHERLLAFGLEGEMFFGAEAELVKHFETIDRSVNGKVAALVLSLRRARNCDASFLSLLRGMQENFRERGVTLLLCGVQSDMMSALAATGLDAQIGANRIFPDESADQPCGVGAVGFAFELLDGSHRDDFSK